MKLKFNKPVKYKNIHTPLNRFNGLLAATCFCMMSCSNLDTNQMSVTGSDSASVFILKKEDVEKKISLPGELIPLERSEIFAKVSGYIKNIQGDIGDVVQKGQVIAELDAPEVIANYAQANADMQSVKSKYISSLDAYKRIVQAAKAEGTVSQGEIERAKNQMVSDSASYEAFKAKLNAQAQLKEYLIIRAPFSGTITQRNFDLGTLVSISNAKPLFVLENNRVLRLRLPVPEAYTSAVLVGATIKFTSDAFPGELFEAKLSRKSGALNIINRTETWEFLYDNKLGKLKSGMFANVAINFGRTAPAFVVPLTAVATTLEKRFVIRLKNQQAEWIDVRNGIALSDRVEIFGELTEGDTLLVRATDEIKPEKKLVPKIATANK